MFFYDPLWMLAIGIGMALSMWASWRTKSNFKKYSKVGVRSGMTGAEAAAAVARAGGVHGLTIERHQGFLSDHYDPRVRALRLSPEVFEGRSIASIAVAAHEAGHAIQHAQAYGPLTLRSKLVPITNIGGRLWIVPILIGSLLMGMSPYLGETLLKVGAALFSLVVLFQLVTLPVEFDASNRAKAVLAETGIVSTQEEAFGVSKVLNAAALTYVAAALTSLMQLLVILLRIYGNRR